MISNEKATNDTRVKHLRIKHDRRAYIRKLIITAESNETNHKQLITKRY